MNKEIERARLNGFQFHKVRLKGRRFCEQPLFYMFQFHKVRLKVDELREKYGERTMFQFHKVRLKDLFVQGFLTDAEKFQFHKVRLKGSRQSKNFTFQHVSIP